MTGEWPASLSRLTVCDPIYPAPPATRTFIDASPDFDAGEYSGGAVSVERPQFLKFQMHAILASIGTDGDIVPYVGLGAELRKRGHRVTLAVAEPWRKTA